MLIIEIKPKNIPDIGFTGTKSLFLFISAISKEKINEILKI